MFPVLTRFLFCPFPIFSNFTHRTSIMRFLILFLSVVMLWVVPAEAQRHSSSSHAGRHSSSSTHTRSKASSIRSYSYSGRHSSSVSSGHHKSNYASGVVRDSHGRIKRSSSARHAFMKQTGYPHGRKGYVIDHKIPLKRGGNDDPSNMQWQTKEDAKRKDNVE